MDKTTRYFFGLSILFIILKLISITTTNFNLYGDEAQYWLWSKDLSFGYFSKPPLLSWLIYLITSVFGDSFFVLKTIPVILYCLTSYSIYIFTRKLFNDASLALCCSITFYLLPSVSFSSFLITTDILLVFFWSLGLYQILVIRENQSYLNFIVLGILLGLAFLSKYAAIYFVISLIFLPFIEKSFRVIVQKHKPKILLLFLTIILILLPNILWNYQNDWITLEHTSSNASLGKLKINPWNSIEFLVAQIVMIGPLLFVAFVYYFYKKTKIDVGEKILICFALPALVIVLIESFLVRAYANWAAVSLVSLSIFFVVIVYRFNKKIIYINNFINLIIGCVLFVLIGTSYPLSVFDRINELPKFVEFLDEKNQKNINNIVISDRLLFASLNYEYYSKNISFYSPYRPRDRIAHHFQLTNALPVNFSENFILIGNEEDIGYLQKRKEAKLLGSKSFLFSSKDLKIYEIIIY